MGLEEGQVDLEYFNSGNAPLLDSHNNDSVDAILGVVEKAYIEDQEGGRVGIAEIRFSPRSEERGIYKDFQAGIIRNASVGYYVHEYQDQGTSEDGIPMRLATNWEPVELSLCPIGADSRAGFRKQRNDMKLSDPEKIKMDELKMKEINSQEIAIQERNRILGISKAVKAASLGEELSQDLIVRGVDLGKASQEILEKLAERSKTQAQVSISPGSYDEKEIISRGVVDALLSRHNPKKYEPTDAGKKFQNLSIPDMARKCLGVSGDFLPPSEIITRSMQSSSDFPMLLGNFMNRLLRDGFQSAPQTWRSWTRTSVAKDFRPQFRIMLSDVNLLEPKNELGEYKASSLDEGTETVTVQEYGRLINISRTALINDDLNAFSRIPDIIARAGADLISKTVYEKLVSNPVMQTDKKRCFDSDHGNIGKAKEVGLESLTEARLALRLQTTMKGQPLGLMPKYLLTTAQNEIRAMQFITQNYLAGVVEATTQQKINPFVNALELIIEPRLDILLDVKQGKNPYAFYNIIDPAQLDTMEVCFLNGQDSVYVESQMEFKTDGLSMKARLDFGCSILEWRGMHFNSGAAPQK